MEMLDQRRREKNFLKFSEASTKLQALPWRHRVNRNGIRLPCYNRTRQFMKTSSLILVSLSVLVYPTCGQIVTFSFNGSSGDETVFSPDSQPISATVGSMSRGPGLTANSFAGAFNSKAWTTAAAIDATDYYSFSIAPNSGFGMTMTSLSLDERRSLTGIRNWSVRSSLDSFSSDLASFTVLDNDEVRTGQSTGLGTAFQDLTSSLEFRIYGFASESGTGTWRIDNVQLSGSFSAVPEPHEYAFVAGLGLIGFAGWRRWVLRREASLPQA